MEENPGLGVTAEGRAGDHGGRQGFEEHGGGAWRRTGELGSLQRAGGQVPWRKEGGLSSSMDVSLLPFFPPWRRTEELGTTKEGMSGVP